MACPCPELAKVRQRFPARDRDTRAIVLTICNCDRLKCRCGAYVDMKATNCSAGHRQGSLTS